MTRSATGKLHVYVVLAGLGLLGALTLGRPELAAIASPFALFVALGLLFAREPSIRAETEIDRERQLETRHVDLFVELSAEQTVRAPRAPARPTGRARRRRRRTRCSSGSRAASGGSSKCRSSASTGGRTRSEGLSGARGTPSDCSCTKGGRESRSRLKVYPHGETVQRLLRPLETQAFSGNQVARNRGEGIEFADLRPFTPGDRIRRVNWRATARRGEPWINEMHPERNADVVLFLDTFAEARRDDLGTLDIGVRAAASLAALYLREKDRVGVVSFGGVLNWLTVTSGTTQLYRIVDSLLDAQIVLSYAWKDLDVIPPRTLPPRALVIALSPLLDERAVGALLDLRARGFDLAVVELSPFSFVPEPETETQRLAYRLWRLRREALRSKYAALGVPIVEWHEGVPMEAVVEEVRAFRRHARVVRA